MGEVSRYLSEEVSQLIELQRGVFVKFPEEMLSSLRMCREGLLQEVDELLLLDEATLV